MARTELLMDEGKRFECPSASKFRIADLFAKSILLDALCSGTNATASRAQSVDMLVAPCILFAPHQRACRGANTQVPEEKQWIVGLS